MSEWSRGVEREIPVGLDGELLKDIDRAWRAAGDELQRWHLTEIALEDDESRLRSVEMFDETKGISLLDAWSVSHGGPEFHLCLLLRSYKGQRNAAGMLETVIRHECRMVGLFSLGHDFGRVLMRPETLSDKLLELVRPREVDFDESKQFSARYYVLTTDEETLRKSFPSAALDHLGGRRDLMVEISGTDMTVLWPEVINEDSCPEACLYFIELAERLAPSSGPYR